MRYIDYVAVLCYSVSSSQFLERQSKNFETANLEWKTAVYNFRFGEVPYHDKMSGYHLMKGPVNAVRSDVIVNER